MAKETVQASSDVALIKYWGKKDNVLRLPENGSVSIILDGLDTVTTVQFDSSLEKDQVVIEGTSQEKEVQRVSRHLDRIRQIAGTNDRAKVESTNTFPRGTGLSSSGSGLAALTIAALNALQIELPQREVSILARQGSGTACRCVCSGIVEWRDADTSDASYSETIFPPGYMDLRDVIAVVDEGQKRVSSTEGHESARSSLFYQARLQNISQKISQIKEAFHLKDFSQIGEIVEAEALEFHSILLTSIPSLVAWYPGTIEVMLEVQQMRRDGVEAYFTINTGFNVHVITLPQYQETVQERISSLSLVKKTINSRVGNGPQRLDKHLF